MIIDNKNKCIIDGCNNVGEWNSIRNLKVYRKKLCSSHNLKLRKNNINRKPLVKEKFKNLRCGICEYCRWEGPCDTHRPTPEKEGGEYTIYNLRSACPNCHRLISMGLIVDKFKVIDKV